MMPSDYRAGFDYSASEAAFAVLDADGRVVFDRTLELGGRDASRLPAWMQAVLEEFHLTFADIRDWSVGGGPGSFTGLRVASAFVMGLSFRHDVRRRCVSTAAALAASVFDPAAQTRVLVLYDGRKNEILGFGLTAQNGFYREDGVRPVIRSAEELAQLQSDYPVMIASAHDIAAVQTVCGSAAAPVVTAEHLHAAELARWNPEDFSRMPTELTYLRPAVFVAPTPIREV